MSRDEREELAELAAATRALVEWYDSTGSAGLPIETSAVAVLTSIDGARAKPASRAQPAAAKAPAVAKPPAPAPAHAAAPPPAPPHVAPAPARANAPAPVPPPARAAAPAVTLAPEERTARLALLAEEVRSCTQCGLHATRTNTVFARGNPFSELCFIGEGPGADEDAQGSPFVGKAGQLLDRMIAAMGYGRDDVYICNIVKCRPPDNRKPEPNEMSSCTPFLTRQIALAQPKVIVALGATAMTGLTGSTEGITRMRGRWRLYKGTIPIMPTFHPAYLLRQPDAKRQVWADLQEVMKHLGKALPGKKG